MNFNLIWCIVELNQLIAQMIGKYFTWSTHLQYPRPVTSWLHPTFIGTIIIASAHHYMNCIEFFGLNNMQWNLLAIVFASFIRHPEWAFELCVKRTSFACGLYVLMNIQQAKQTGSLISVSLHAFGAETPAKSWTLNELNATIRALAYECVCVCV